MKLLVSSCVALSVAVSMANANFSEDLAGQTVGSTGQFLQHGNGAFDWIYVTGSGTPLKLEGIDPETGYFIWSNMPGPVTISGTSLTFPATGYSTDCPTGTTEAAAIGTTRVCTLPTTISSDLTLDGGKYYAIDGEVTVEAGATLAIDAGVTLFGNTGQSYLAVDQGAKIEAVGRGDAPIIFTSKQDVEGDANADDQGQWGGLSIFGYATTTRSSQSGYEQYEAGDHQFGCDAVTAQDCNNEDNSGTLKYIMIKHSGYEVETDKELNGLSLGGIGSGTTIENVYVSGSLDDGIELWGGTVNLKNVYLYNNADDSLDFDHGWTGTADNVYIEQNVVDGDGSRGIESDTDGGHEDYTPVSDPVIKNMTIKVAADAGQGIMSREAVAGQYRNVIIESATTLGKALIAVRSNKTLTNGLSYSDVMLVSTGGAPYYEGHTEDTTDNIIGDTTAQEVEALVNKGYVVETTSMPASDRLVTGANMAAFDWVQ